MHATSQAANKIHADQIDKLTMKLLEYKKRIRNLERADVISKAEIEKLKASLEESQ